MFFETLSGKSQIKKYTRYFGWYRWRLLYLLLLIIIISGCSNEVPIPKDSIIPKDRIRLISSISELQFVSSATSPDTINNKQKKPLEPVSAKKGLDVAFSQALLWDDSTKLVHVSIGDVQLKAQETAPADLYPVTWIYIFKADNHPGNWLAVLVSSNGVLDVGVGEVMLNQIKYLHELCDWKINSESLERQNQGSGWKLFVVPDRFGENKPMWVSFHKEVLPHIERTFYRIYDAINGEELTEWAVVDQAVKAELEKRRRFWRKSES